MKIEQFEIVECVECGEPAVGGSRRCFWHTKSNKWAKPHRARDNYRYLRDGRWQARRHPDADQASYARKSPGFTTWRNGDLS